MTATFTSEFGREFEQERGRWLRRRLMWYCGVMLVINGLGFVGVIVAGIAIWIAKEYEVPVDLITLNLIAGALALALFGWAFNMARRKILSREATLRIVYWLIVLSGALALGGGLIGFEFGLNDALVARQSHDAQESGSTPALDAEAEIDAGIEPSLSASPDETAEPGVAETVAMGAGDDEADDSRIALRDRVRMIGSSFGQVFFAHFFACLFLPWTPRESFRPLVPLLGLNALIVIFYIPGWLAPSLLILCSPLVAVPGAAICWWRHSRFRKRYHFNALRGRYGEMKRELTDARRIHESLFPQPVRTGAVRFDFVYEPMRQIGGDYLYCHRFPGLGDDAHNEPLSVVIIDVTGHGVPAALTVNRLHGELERLFGEDPDISPGDVLTALNRYVHLTLATHSVYATALCLRVDPRQNLLEWASGGHPPAFVRSIDGRLDRLDSTAFVLGACHGEDFQADQRSIRFLPGDTLIAYTDGATEARDQRGAMLRVEGLQAVIHTVNPRAVADGGWASAVLRAVDQHRWGPAADDTLIVEMYRPL